MSYQSRVKKRKYKAAVKRSQRERSPDTRKRWYLTIAKRDTRCGMAGCGSRIKAGSELLYRHDPKEVRCYRCGSGLSFRTSLRWEKARNRRKQQHLVV